MIIGIALSSSSFNAMSSDVLAPTGIAMNGGAPCDSCSARAPSILAFSNRVNVGGPIAIFSFLARTI